MSILVIIPLFNKEKTITRAVESVLAQTYTDFKLLIANDGSTDDSINRIPASDQIIIHDQINAGVSAARNNGIAYAQNHNYDYTAFLDGDDYWSANHLSNLLVIFERNNTIDLVAANYKTTLAKNVLLKNYFSKPPSNGAILNPFFTYMHKSSIINGSNFIIKTSAFSKSGLFNTNLTHGEDTDFIINAGLHLAIAFSGAVSVMIDKSLNGSNSMLFNNRRYPDLTAYKKFTSVHNGLEKYLHNNLSGIIITGRLQDKQAETLRFEKALDKSVLSIKQRLLLNLPIWLLRRFKKFQTLVRKSGTDLRMHSL